MIFQEIAYKYYSGQFLCFNRRSFLISRRHYMASY